MRVIVGLCGSVGALMMMATAAGAATGADYGPTDNGHRVHLASSPIFTVGLPGHAGTGYTWTFVPGRSHGIALLASKTREAPVKLGFVGGPETTVFTLRANEPRGDVVIADQPPGRRKASAFYRLRVLRAGVR